MKQQEYTVIDEIEPLNLIHFAMILNSKGKEGWKYVGKYNTWLIFMRDKEDNETMHRR
jgi:hypothetical protein